MSWRSANALLNVLFRPKVGVRLWRSTALGAEYSGDIIYFFLIFDCLVLVIRSANSSVTPWSRLEDTT